MGIVLVAALAASGKGAARCEDYIGLLADKIGSHLRQTIGSIVRPTVDDPYVLSIDKSDLLQPLAKASETVLLHGSETSLSARLGRPADVRCTTALPPKADVHPRSCYVAFVPYVWPGRAVQDGLPRSTNVRAASMYQASEVERFCSGPSWVSARIRGLLLERPQRAIMAPSLLVAPGRPFVHLFIPSRRPRRGSCRY
jgi:hypothetical protein